MLKRLISIVLTISLILGMTTIALGASQPNIDFELNGIKAIQDEELYFNEEGQIMCPLREIAEKLDYIVTWDGKDKSITLSKGSEVARLKIAETNIIVNGVNRSMGTMPLIKEGKTFVPIEFFSKDLNLIVGWDNKYQKLKINQSRINAEDYFTRSEDNKIENELNTYMESLQEHQNFHGSVLVAKGGQILLNKGYGFADFQQNTENKSQTKFAIGSITKQFTAMAIMQLSEKGLLDVEDKVSKYIPDLPVGDQLTIHNLLTHTSGLANVTDLVEFYSLNPDNKDPMVVVDLIKDMSLEFNPGEKYNYSNTNYLLLGMIVEKLSGLSYEDYLQKNIFTPLNMKDTGICYGKNNQTHDATAYDGYLEVFPVDDELLLKQAYGAGNMYSTVEDLYRWDQALKTEKLVKKETLDKIFTGYATIPGAGSYGYGWIISDTVIGREIWHNGATFGFTSNIARFTDEDFTVIILTNNRLYNTVDLSNTLASIAFQMDYEMPEVIKEIEIEDSTIYDKYVGEYELMPSFVIKISKENDKIYAQVTGQDKYEIFPASEKEYFYKVVDAQITFVEDENGEIVSLILHQNGQDMSANKVK